MKFTSYIYYCLLVISLSACSFIGSIDDIQPKNVLTDETLITDKRSAQSAVDGIYAAWRSIHIGWFVNYYSTLSGSLMPQSIYNIEDFAKKNVKPENTPVKNVYTSTYNVINMANSVIAILEKNTPEGLNEQSKNELLAQARFNRALAHFNLLRIFGEFYDTKSQFGIVIYKEPVRDNQPKKRASVAEVYDTIIEDLLFAAEKGIAVPENHARVGKTTAKALLAKVYLSKGDFTNASKYAIETINEAANHGYALETDYLNIFRGRFNSQEMLFAPYTSYTKEYTFMFTNNFQAGPILKKIADELVQGDGNDNTGEGYDPRYAMTFSKVAIMHEGNFSHNNNKYMPIVFQEGAPMNTYMLLRLGEVYLIAAEAEARINKYESACGYLQTICSRAGYPSDYVSSTVTKDNILEMILKHKWIEINTENNEEWFDLARYKKLGNIALVPYFMEREAQFIMPIPRGALGGNNLLVQNPGYE